MSNEYPALLYSRMSSKYAHNIDLMNTGVFLVVVFKDSHPYNHKPESNGHIKYIGRRRLSELRNQVFFTSNSTGWKWTPANLDFLSIVLILLWGENENYVWLSEVCIFSTLWKPSVLFVNINFKVPYSHCIVYSAISKIKLHVTSIASVLISRNHEVLYYPLLYGN